MSENTVTESAPAVETVWEAPAGPAAIILQDVNEKVAEYNTLQARLTAATGDKSALIADRLNTSENAEVKALMAKADDALLKAEKLRADAEKIVKAEVEAEANFSEADIEAARADLKKKREAINAGRTYLRTNYGDVALTAVAGMVGAKGSGTKGSGKGSGGMKPRVTNVYVNGEVASAEVKNEKTGESRIVSTFTLAAKKIPGAKVPDLQAAWLDAAGVEKWDDAPNVVEFVVSGSDGANYTVKVER
jgi:hypothetical protein